MTRAYTIATSALTLGTSAKWLDNTLSHYSVQGVVQEKQGVARRITVEGLVVLSLAQVLIADLGMTVSNAIELAQKTLAGNGVFESPNGLRLELRIDDLRSGVLSRLERAVEVAPLPRRGRPPKSKTGRLD